MKDWRIWEKFAKLNIIKTRSAQYLSVLNFIMIGKVFVETFENRSLGWTLFVVGVSALIIWGFIDYLFILGKEQEIYWRKNPAFDELNKNEKSR